VFAPPTPTKTPRTEGNPGPAFLQYPSPLRHGPGLIFTQRLGTPTVDDRPPLFPWKVYHGADQRGWGRTEAARSRAIDGIILSAPFWYFLGLGLAYLIATGRLSLS
jgi:hypothetical protein